tara:strand:+ start:6622 stop:7182 length:561 start_codon:yes stop_codon:yes gene_type:complete
VSKGKYIIPLGDQNDMLLDKGLEAFNFEDPQKDPIKFAKELIETMQENNGIGLAANQIGVPLKVFCMQTDPPMVCYNPRITYASEETVILDEGCLSYPGVWVKIERPQMIRCRFQDPYGNMVTKKFAGMAARVFQHEMEHLEGKLFWQNANWFNQEKFQKRWIKAKRTLRNATRPTKKRKSKFRKK